MNSGIALVTLLIYTTVELIEYNTNRARLVQFMGGKAFFLNVFIHIYILIQSDRF